MKKALLLFLLTSLLLSCEKDLKFDKDEFIPLDRQELNDKILSQMGEEELWHWQKQDVETILSAALLSDSIIAVGYTGNGMKDLSELIHVVDVQSAEWREIREELEFGVLKGERYARNDQSLRFTDIAPAHMQDDWPTMFVQITSIETMHWLKKHEAVRYLEPTGYWIMDESQGDRSTSGCSGAPSYNINSSDYETIAPNTKQPWNHAAHGITQAWEDNQGDGRKICIIDTGSSDEQDNLGSSFNSGYSSGRNINRYSTHWSGSWWWASLDSPNDQCGHGTAMSGLAAAPRGNDGNATGVAYMADLTTVRATQDVIITSSNEKRGVRDALKLAANTECHIASISLGTPFYSSTVADGVHYANNNGVLTFAAAGTSISFLSWYGVIFPATMSQTVAVTGVKEGLELEACDACHDGSAVDYVIVMERSNNNSRHSLSLATYSNQPQYIGGSSCATATMAGIAALVWSEHPSESNWEINNRLRQACEFYPSQHPDFGYGRISVPEALN